MVQMQRGRGPFRALLACGFAAFWATGAIAQEGPAIFLGEPAAARSDQTAASAGSAPASLAGTVFWPAGPPLDPRLEVDPPRWPAGGFEASQQRTMRFDLPQSGPLHEPRRGLPAKAGGDRHDPTIEATDKAWCDRLLAYLASVPAEEPSPEGAGDAAAAATPVHIPDAVLRRAVVEALGKSPGDPITRGQMATLRTLSPESGVRQLAGIERAVNLRQFCATASDISNLAPLAGMASLEHLILDGGEISDLTPLARLRSLAYLSLDGNAASNLTPLGALTSLAYLSLEANGISDLAPLAALSSLESLHLLGKRHWERGTAGGAELADDARSEPQCRFGFDTAGDADVA